MTLGVHHEVAAVIPPIIAHRIPPAAFQLIPTEFVFVSCNSSFHDFILPKFYSGNTEELPKPFQKKLG